MPSLIISSASRSSPRIFIYHSSHIILIPSSSHSIILAFFTFPLIHFTMVLFAISSKLIFAHFIYHTLLFITPSSFPSYFTSITLITTHLFSSLPIRIYVLYSFIYIHSHPILPLNHFNHTHSYPFPFNNSHSIPFHHSHSFPYPLLTPHSHMFSGILVLHYQVFILFSLIPTLFIDSYHSSFLFNGTDIIHLISSLLTLITSLYLLSFSINLDSILCSMYYDLSISYP